MHTTIEDLFERIVQFNICTVCTYSAYILQSIKRRIQNNGKLSSNKDYREDKKPLTQWETEGF